METKVKKWGNSLGIIIPNAFAKETDIEAGSLLEKPSTATTKFTFTLTPPTVSPAAPAKMMITMKKPPNSPWNAHWHFWKKIYREALKLIFMHEATKSRSFTKIF